MQNLISFDIEIANVFTLQPGEDLDRYAPFDISVAAVMALASVMMGLVAAHTGSATLSRVYVCPANCDGSTTPPVLNVNDFSCFLNKFAAGDAASNCDCSTTVPILNVVDFSCFLNEFAAGCP